jgi:hypothetical protein
VAVHVIARPHSESAGHGRRDRERRQARRS